MSEPRPRSIASETAATYIGQLGGQRKRKVSVTIDDALWDQTQRDAELAGRPVSAVVEEALALWSANRRLRGALDDMYAEMPESRPTEAEVEAAQARLRADD